MGKEYWIARDFNGDLYLYDKKPIKPKVYSRCFHPVDGSNEYYKIDERLFPEITFENSPQIVTMVVKV